jgi:hypothetical protein
MPGLVPKNSQAPPTLLTFFNKPNRLQREKDTYGLGLFAKPL